MRDGRELVGLGMATAIYHVADTRPPHPSRCSLTGPPPCGAPRPTWAGHLYLPQVAADALGLPMQWVRFELGNSTFPPAKEHGGSTTMASVRSAVQAACAELRSKLADLGSGTNDYEGLLRKAGSQHVDADVSAAPGDEAKAYSSVGFGAVFADVRVDPELCTIRVARVIGAYDAGRIVNPKLARSQCIGGGMVGGIGMALLEEAEWDANLGRVANATTAE